MRSDDGTLLPIGPLYEVNAKDGWMVKGIRFMLKPEEEPLYRAYCAGIAPLCGGRAVLEPPPPREKRGFFGRRKE